MGNYVSYIPGGRMGNALFQAAAAWAYAKRNGLKFSIPKYTSSDYWSPIYLRHLIAEDFNPSSQSIKIFERQFHYEPIPFFEHYRGNNIILQGYWQSHLYFDEYQDELLDAFNFKWEHIPDVCSLHARFTDYLTIEGKHIVVNEEYILKAIEIIKEKTGITRIKVFSDDLNYFKQNFGNLYPFEYSTNKTIEEDLIEISCCHSQINSSSTFSWWGSYLNRNKDKVTVNSRKWFMDNWKDEYGRPVDTKDIFLPEWILI